MTTTPNAVLIVRVHYALTKAQLELQNGDPTNAALSIATALENLERVQGL